MGIQIDDKGSTLVVKWSKELEDYFRDRKIYVDFPEGHSAEFTDGQSIEIRKDILVEQYSMQTGYRIYEFGAFSFCRSPLIHPDFKLGRFCSVEENVKVVDREQAIDSLTKRPLNIDERWREVLDTEFGVELNRISSSASHAELVVGNNVRIGCNSSILRGVTIGDGAVIRPNSVVSQDVPAFSIVEGNPARIVGFRFDSDELRARVLTSRWWEYEVAGLPLDVGGDAPEFLKEFESRRDSGELKRAKYSKFDVAGDLMGVSENTSFKAEIGAASPKITWQDFMQDRVRNKEKGIPWFLHDKLKCYEYLKQHGISTVTPLRIFNDPKLIDLEGLPDSFVIKPSLQSSTKGVMVLTKRGEDTYWDEMRGRALSVAEVIDEQQKYFDETKAAGKTIIVEPKIIDLEPDRYSIPRDFKAYAFRGEIALMLEVDRNTKPSSVSWYDENFDLISDDRIIFNESFVHETSKEAPACSQEILDLARRTSAELPTPFARVDMYLTADGPMVGEITLAPGGLYHGKHYRMSEEQQRLMGDMWRQAAASMSRSS